MIRKFLIVLTLLFLVMVSGCKSNGEYNEYGIREKEMNSLVTILKPEDKIPVIESNTSTSIRLHFINKDIAFEAYSNDGYFTNNNGLDLKGMMLSYEGNSYVDVNWRYSTSKGKRVSPLGILYINFVVKQKNNIIGYIIVKNFEAPNLQDGYTRYRTETHKAVVFPDVIDGQKEMSYDIVKALIKEENNYYEYAENPMYIGMKDYKFVTIDQTVNPNIIEENNQLKLENAFNINFQNNEFEYHIYSEKAYFIEGNKGSHYIVVDAYEEWYKNEAKTYRPISFYWDCTRYEEQNDIKSIAPTYIYIFIMERNNLMGTVRMSFHKTDDNFDGLWNKYQFTIKSQKKYFIERSEAIDPQPSIEQIYEFYKELEEIEKEYYD